MRSTAPHNYQQWQDVLRVLEEDTVSEDFLLTLNDSELEGGGIVMDRFLNRLQQTVNNMLQLSIRQTSRLLNAALEDGDYSSLSVILIRLQRKWRRCRFYLRLPFLPDSLKKALDEQVVMEMQRYWDYVQKTLCHIADESYQPGLEDEIYLISRIKVCEERDAIWATTAIQNKR